MPPPRLILTSGEPAGIGPDLCIDIASRAWPCDLVDCRRHAGVAVARAAAAANLVTLLPYSPGAEPAAHRAGTLRVLHVPVAAAGSTRPARSRQRASRSDAARSRSRRLHVRRVRSDGHGARAEERDQRCRRPVLRPHRIPGRTHRRGPSGHDAGERLAARCARDDASAAEGRQRCHHRRAVAASAAHRRRRSAQPIRNRCAAHPGVRPQSARRRVRPPRPRGNRSHRAGARRVAPDRHAADGPRACRHRLHRADAASKRTRCSRCITTRACR